MFLGWIYDDDIFHPPTPYGSDDNDDDNDGDYQPAVDEFYDCTLTEDTGFKGRVNRTFSYANLRPRSQTNFRSQSRKILMHVLNILTAKEADCVWEDLINDEYEDPNDEK